MKRLFVGFCWGLDRQELDESAEQFVAKHIPAICYPGILEELDHLREEGRRTILVSASPELYVSRIGRALGFDHTFGTVIDWGQEVGWFPRFPLGNNKGANKVVRLRDELGLEGLLPKSVGYSDSAADLPMLALCEEQVAVNPEGSFRAKAEAEGWRILRPERPFRNRREFGWACLLMMLGLYRR